MKPATTIVELYQNLSPSKFLTPDRDKDQYVDLYGEKLGDIKFSLLSSGDSNQTVYASGQSGTGKSTALFFLPDNEIQENFHFLYINGNDLLDLSDVDIADLLLVLCYALIKSSDSLQSKFEKQLERIKATAEERLKIESTYDQSLNFNTGATAKAEIGNSLSLAGAIVRFFTSFKGSMEGFMSIKYDNNHRKTIREAFVIINRDLLELTNKIIVDYCEEKGGDKELLIIFNDLDNIKNDKQIEALFIQNRYFIEGLKCRKVVSIPAYLSTRPDFNADIFSFDLKLDHNPLLRERKPKIDNLIARNKQLLHQIIKKRMSESVNLIDDDAIDYAIKMSGGIVRQFIAILHNAAAKAGKLKLSKISLEDAKDGASDYRRILERSIMSKSQLDMLDYIRLHHKPDVPDNNAFITALLGNQVIVCENDPRWYDINPLIENSVKIWKQSDDNQSS